MELTLGTYPLISTEPTSKLDYATPTPKWPWYRLHLRGLLLTVGVLCTVGAALGILLSALWYIAISSFPVPDSDPIPSGPRPADILLFIGLGLIGIFGVALVVASRVVHNKEPSGDPTSR